MKYTWWTMPEINKCKDLFKSGKSFEEIAKKLDRSELSIKNLLYTERVINTMN